jgi:hypothetical protein
VPGQVDIGGNTGLLELAQVRQPESQIIFFDVFASAFHWVLWRCPRSKPV